MPVYLFLDHICLSNTNWQVLDSTRIQQGPGLYPASLSQSYIFWDPNSPVWKKKRLEDHIYSSPFPTVSPRCDTCHFQSHLVNQNQSLGSPNFQGPCKCRQQTECELYCKRLYTLLTCSHDFHENIQFNVSLDMDTFDENVEDLKNERNKAKMTKNSNIKKNNKNKKWYLSVRMCQTCSKNLKCISPHSIIAITF